MAPSIETRRTKLLPVAAGDVVWMCQLLWQPQVRCFLCDDALLPRGDVEAMITDCLDSNSVAACWRIETRDGRNVGLVSLRPPSPDVMRLRAIGWRSLELVVALDPGAWGLGFATEAVDAVATHAAEDGVTFAVLAAVDEPNERSHRLFQRCSFQELGRVAGPKHPLIVVYERAV